MAESAGALFRRCFLLSILPLACNGEQKSWIQVGKDLHLYNNVIHLTTTNTIISCGVECSLNPECQGFDFRPWDGRCTLHDAANVTSFNLQTQHPAEHATLNFVHLPEICDHSAGMCLMFVNMDMNWNDGRTYCQTFGMDLAILDTEQKWNFAKAARAGSFDRYFVGASNMDDREHYRWLNNQPVDAKRFKPTPESHHMNCVAFYTNQMKKMKDGQCSSNSFIMCGK